MSNAGTYARNRAGKPIKLKIGERCRPKRKRIFPQATLRGIDLDRYFDDRYGPVLPDDDAGREDVMIYLNHLAYRQADRTFLMHEWLDQRAPWLVGAERRAFMSKAFKHPIRYTADTLAEKLGLTYARRMRLGITTIGAIDMPKEKREELRKAKARERMRKARQKAGAMSRSEYVADTVKARAEAAGVSRATWYRQQIEAPSLVPTGPKEPVEPKTHYAANGLVSRGLTVASS